MYLIHFCLIFRSTQKRGESFGISRIGSKIKGVFKSTTMEGAMLPNYGLAEGEDDFKPRDEKRNLILWRCVPFRSFFIFYIT